MDNLYAEFTNDKLLGGNKKCFKITMIDNKYIIYYLDLSRKCHNGNIVKFKKYTFSESVVDELQYLKGLFTQNIIQLNTIYNANSTEFINMIHATKKIIFIENYYEFLQTELLQYHLEHMNTFRPKNWIRKLFYCNVIINDEIYCTSYESKYKESEFNVINLDIGLHDYKLVYIYEIENKFYDYYSCIRKYMPYCIEYNATHYCLLDRNYKCIDIDYEHKYLENSKREYLFNDECKPWNSKDYLISMRIKLHTVITVNNLLPIIDYNDITKDLAKL
jgi:hypothetical protein